jgi:hypothetical protein
MGRQEEGKNSSAWDGTPFEVCGGLSLNRPKLGLAHRIIGCKAPKMRSLAPSNRLQYSKKEARHLVCEGHNLLLGLIQGI